MPQEKNLEFLDILIIVLKRRIFLLVLFFSILILSYLAIYFLIDEQFEATALIVPSEQPGAAFSSLLKGVSDFPLAGLAGIKSSPSTELYNTLIYSRTNMEKVVRKFNLEEDYDVDNIEDALKRLKNQISTDDENEKSFIVSVRAKTPEKAAEMTNYVVDLLNRTVIDLNISKSRSNREFLEARYNEIKFTLTKAEDSLRKYQDFSGVFEAEEQVKLTMKVYGEYEAQIAVKEVEMAVLEKLYGKDSPQYISSKITVDEYLSKLNNIRSGTAGGKSVVLPINTMPAKSMDYLRIFRDVTINNALLEFVLPLYEQAKFEEQKDIPILQVVDYAVPPLKRVYPKRTLTAIIFSIIITLLVTLTLIIMELVRQSDNPKMQFVRQNLNFRK
jgi:tyrosine-protein kinase Etk/Wzc